MKVVCAIDDKTYIWPNGTNFLLDNNKNLDFLVLIKRDNNSRVVRIKDLKIPLI